MKTLQKIFKKYSDRLVEVHLEDDDDISYWATLKPGWVSNLECCLIHERTIREIEEEIKNSRIKSLTIN